VFGRAAACLIVCAAAAVAGPVARADNNSDQVAGARKALHRYFDLMDGGQVDVAVSYCHATDAGEQALASALTKVWYAQMQSARAVQGRFGDDAVGQTVGRPTLARTITTCPAAVDGNAVILQIERKFKMRMVRVGPEWKLSMADVAEEFGGRQPAALAGGLQQVEKILKAVADGVPKGKYKDVAALRRALDQQGYNISETKPSGTR
jgi:hypothetical protein